MEAKIGVMCLQAKECQGCPGLAWSQERGMKQFHLDPSVGINAAGTLILGLEPLDLLDNKVMLF